MASGGQKQNAIAVSEHIGFDDTGDNISAKKVAMYGYSPTTAQWGRIALLADTPYGRQPVELTPHQIFYDPFDAALDTTDRWTTPTVGNSAVLASNSAGSMILGTGTTASGWSKLTSQVAFTPTVPGWIGFSFLNLLPDLAAPVANSYRFWGMGTIASVPTTAAPMTDAVGFEVTTAGHLCCVIYTAGTRTVVADLFGTTQPVDAFLHRYIIKYRTDRIYFYIDGESSSTLVATYSGTTATSGPSVQTLNISFLAVGGATPPVSNTQIVSQGAVVWDAAQNNNTLSDGTFQWRKLKISAAGGANTQEQPQSVVTGALLNTTSTAYETSRVIKNTTGRLYRLAGYNSLASAQFIQLHNTTSLPADTAVPVFVVTVPASSNFSIDFGVFGRYFSTGITVCNSTTGPTKTIGAANLFIDAGYV